MNERPGIDGASRAVLGAIAGFAGTVLMTAAMQRLHERLPSKERYPLTPREISDRVMPAEREEIAATRTLVAHFAYGALTGALYGLGSRRYGLFSGALYGVGVWCASYLGWIPGLGILKSATQHPARRNALMLTAHVVWGIATAISLAELARAHRQSFAGGPYNDAPG